jgi:hypothetical protein
VIKKLIALVGIAGLCVAMTATTGVAKPQVKKVESSITLNFSQGSLPYSPYTQDVFSGRVKAKKGCKKNRTVEINNTALSGTTDSSGDYVIAAGNVSPGTYTATVLKKIRKNNNGTKIICKPATSDPVTVP